MVSCRNDAVVEGLTSNRCTRCAGVPFSSATLSSLDFRALAAKGMLSAEMDALRVIGRVCPDGRRRPFAGCAVLAHRLMTYTGCSW